MGWRIFRDADGYILVFSPPGVPTEREETGLTRGQLLDRLRTLELPVRDEMEAIADADDIYRQGWTGTMRGLHQVRRRAEDRAGTPEDIAFVRRLLDDPAYPFRPEFLMDTLRRLESSGE